MTNANLEIYNERWKALNGLIDEAIAYYGKLPDAPLASGQTSPCDPYIYLPRRDLIVNLLKCLQAFAAGQFQFFYYGFQTGPRLASDPILQQWDEFPPEDILTAIIEQTSHDLALIQRAADQRMSSSKRMQETLGKADKLAMLALQPAWQYGVIKKPETVLTYFEKASEFYNIPYANVALISIPFTCTTVNQDFLAIPHEAGHYVYRHLSGTLEKEFRRLRLLPKATAPYQDWARTVFEEMCADIYGCLVGGPVMALDFQELSLANANDNFIGSDGVHPNPALRPLIYSQVLASELMTTVTEGVYARLAQKLADRWNQALIRRHTLTFYITATRADTNFGGGGGGYGIAEAIQPVLSAANQERGNIGKIVETAIEAILAYVTAYLNTYNPNDTERPKKVETWSGPIDDDSDLDLLQSDFDERLLGLLARATVDADLQLSESNLCKDIEQPANADMPRRPASWMEWIKEYNLGSDPHTEWPEAWRNPAAGVPDAWPDNTSLLSGELRNPDRMQKGTWGYILYANGWATGGPSGDEHGHPLQ